MPSDEIRASRKPPAVPPPPGSVKKSQDFWTHLMDKSDANARAALRAIEAGAEDKELARAISMLRVSVDSFARAEKGLGLSGHGGVTKNPKVDKESTREARLRRLGGSVGGPTADA